MQNHEREDLGRAVMEAIMRHERPAVIRSVALEAKLLLKDENLALWQMAWAIDQLVTTYAPDPGWVWGLADQEPSQVVQTAAQNGPGLSDRAKRVVAIAEGLIRDGAKTVATKAIAERLRAEGDEGKPRNLAVAAGNVLARVQGWERVRDGEYAPIGVQQELETVA